MKKWLFLIFAGAMLVACDPQDNLNSQDTLPDGTTGTFTDARDGNMYKTVKIGKQIWMAENREFLYAGQQQANAPDNRRLVFCY
jgi:hypothetical protein